MSKLVRLNRQYWPNEDFGYWCPGCNSGHEVAVNQKNHSNAQWSFNGDFQRPTFSPSLNLKINTPDMGERYQPRLDRPSAIASSATARSSFSATARTRFAARRSICRIFRPAST
jgi:hypothetical protein